MTFLRTKSLYLLLLPVFFVFHGYTVNYDYIAVKEASLLALLYIVSAMVIACISYLFYRDITKASLAAFLFMAFHFFFGKLQDILRNYFDGTFFSKYSFILLLCFAFLLLSFWWLKRRSRPLNKIVLYLNSLLLLIIFTDAILLASKIIRPQSEYTFKKQAIVNNCDTCQKPDIYFILMDGYSGDITLKEFFQFDNTSFEYELFDRNFHIVSNSSSNYNSTPYSIASMLNMDYLRLDINNTESRNLHNCYRTIRDNATLQFLGSSGYKFYNYSIFDFNREPAIITENFLPTRTKLITSQTFISRFWNDIGYRVLTRKLGIKSIEKKHFYAHLHNNVNFLALTHKLASVPSSSPKFAYTHLIMPHYPYYYDSKGNALPFDSLATGRSLNKENYIEYLRYCNGVILQLVDDIVKKSASPPIIILASDHGSREIFHKDRDRIFKNFIAVSLPSRDYSRFYSTLSTVNLFRTVLNTQFNQSFPVLKDSSIYLIR